AEGLPADRRCAVGRYHAGAGPAATVTAAPLSTTTQPSLAPTRERRLASAKTAIIFAAFGLTFSQSPAPHAQSPGIRFEDIARPKPGAWPTYDGSLSGNRFSPLDQINTGNVQKLAPRWMFTLQDAPRALEGTPVVVDGVMYVTSVNEAIALDARTGREI